MSFSTSIMMAAVVAVFAGAAMCADDAAMQITRVRPQNAPLDPRLQSPRTLHQGSGFKPYTDKNQWQQRAQYLRQQVLLAAGLWPLPDKCALDPVIHSPRDCGDYTVQKVFFQSYPGFYVTGNLYRPKGKNGPFAGVLSPHGHWANGRFYRNNDKDAEAEITGSFEKDIDAARYPLQARCANLAKLGCVVFHYDMVGYADADPQRFPHRKTFTDPVSSLYSLSIFGLQTWDSIRALDFLLSLPDVDKERIACTGASGGGTQTFILMTIDDRLKVAAPVCMISAGEHQGGCVCENAPLLRLFTDNVEFAATFAPRPFIHPTATGDWTAHFMEQGLPEIKAIYKLFDAQAMVDAVRFEAGHNYNLNNRQAVYNFFNTHLRLGQTGTVTEQKFRPIEPQNLSVFDADHPRPANSVDSAALSKYLIDGQRAQIEALKPRDKESLDRFRDVVLVALRHMIAAEPPASNDVAVQKLGLVPRQGFTLHKLLLSRRSADDQIPALLFIPDNPTGAATVLIHPQGKAGLLKPDGTPAELLAAFLEKRCIVLAPDVFLTGELASTVIPATNPTYEFFAGYNRTTLANRVLDILTAVAALKAYSATTSTPNLVGTDSAGPWCLLAKALAGDAIGRTAADANRFDFDSVKTATDENYLPASLRFGGIWPLAALAAPGELLVYNTPRAARPDWLLSAYGAARALDKLRIEPAIDAAGVVAWITR